MCIERLDFRRTRSLYVNVRNWCETNNLSQPKGGRAMTETLHQATQAYLEHLRSQGKKERTLYTYGKDFEQIEGFFGSERKLSAILTPHVGKFFKSDALLKLPSGRERSQPTVEKTKRVLRMFLIWASSPGSRKNPPQE